MIPINFIYIMDNDCYKLFSLLVQKESYWDYKGKLDNGYFIKSIREIASELNIKNHKDVSCTIQALVNAELIEVIAEERKFETAKFKINWNKVKELAESNLHELKEFGIEINKLKRTEPITYTNKCTDKCTNICTKCTTTKDKLNNINILNKNNINNNTRINIKEKELNEDIFKKMKEASSSIDDAPIKRKSKNYTMIIDIDDNPILDEYIMSRAEECKKVI